MSTHKHIDRICAIAAVLSLLLCLLFMNGQALGIQPASRTMGYEAKLFDTSRVHTIDIVMDGWDSFIDTCENEEYAACAAVIDGEAYKNIAIRAKGNTSLSSVSQMDSDRYSFKLEFDHYDSGKSYHGLDKLSLNNLIQDNTMMKDYLVYRLMAQYGVNAPLCSFVYITVNGEDWGLYLAVEGVEDSFLQRNYGSDYGNLYKPDSMGFGGGRGNGRDFNIENFMDRDSQEDAGNESSSGNMQLPDGQWQDQPSESNQNQQQGFPSVNFDPDSMGNGSFPGGNFAPGSMGDGGFPSGNFDPGGVGDGSDSFAAFGGGFNFGGMGSSDVKLQYIDDDPDSYSNIFNNAKTDVIGADKTRLIRSLKTLSEGGDVSEALDIDQVLRYFVVHNFVANSDSYTGAMVHNYYLYEKDGRLSMLPWDYNLAFGTFQGGNASSAVNDPIDSPLSVTGNGDRPMADWIFRSEEYTQLYHQYFEEFLTMAAPGTLIDEAYVLIVPYVEKDPTKFCTYEQFESGVDTLKTFCTLRTQSVSGQLDGTIPSTSAGQRADSSALVDTAGITVSDMGTMSQGGGFDRPGGDGQPAFDGEMPFPPIDGETSTSPPGGGNENMPSGQFPEQGQRPNDMETGHFSWRSPGGNFDVSSPSETSSQSGTSLILLAVSAAVLLAGLIVAVKFRR